MPMRIYPVDTFPCTERFQFFFLIGSSICVAVALRLEWSATSGRCTASVGLPRLVAVPFRSRRLHCIFSCYSFFSGHITGACAPGVLLFGSESAHAGRTANRTHAAPAWVGTSTAAWVPRGLAFARKHVWTETSFIFLAFGVKSEAGEAYCTRAA